MRLSVVPAVCVLAGLCFSASGQTTNGRANSGSQTTTGSAAAQTSPASAQTPAPANAQTAPPLKLEDLPPEPHTPTPEEQAEIRRRQQAAAINRIAALQAHWGAAMSTPGISVSMKEISRTKTPAGTEITWQVTATGFTTGERLSLMRWPLDSSVQTTMDGLTVSPSGEAICAGSDTAADAGVATGTSSCTKTMQPNQPLEVKAIAASGEAIRIALLDPGQKRGAATSAVPFPVSGVDKGCKIQMLLGLKNAGLVLIEGDGFPPNSTVTLDTASWGEKHVLNARTNPDGHLVTAMLSGVQGHNSGQTTVSYQGTSCAPSLTYSWGEGSYKVQ